MMKGGTFKAWTWREHERLLSLAAAKSNRWDEVAAEMPGRSAGACQSRFQNYETGELRIKDRAAVAAAAAARREAAAVERSLTAEFFGDPLPGRSALDKRRAAPEVRSISLAGGGM